MSAVKKTPSKEKQVNNKTPVKSTGKKQVNKQSNTKIIPSASNKKTKNMINDIKEKFLSQQNSKVDNNQSLFNELTEILSNESIQQANSQFTNLLDSANVSIDQKQTNEKALIKILKKLNLKQLNGLVYLIKQYLESKGEHNNTLSVWIYAIHSINSDLIISSSEIKQFVSERSSTASKQSQIIASLQGKIQLLIGF